MAPPHPVRTPRAGGEAGTEPPLAFSARHMSAVDSTNDEAKREAARGAPAGTLIVADSQTRGRGRHGRTWISPAGNLYFSLLLRPACPAADAAQVSFVAALAAFDAVAAALGTADGLTCKWPNDVLINGRKVAGILLESALGEDGRLAWLVVGVGINVATSPDPGEVMFPATSLRAAGAESATPKAVLDGFRAAFQDWYGIWRAKGFAAIRTPWRERAFALGAPVHVRLGGETVTGLFRDVDSDGALVLADDGGERRITAGDVFPGPA